MAAEYADPTQIAAHIADICNAQQGVWGGAILAGLRGKVNTSFHNARKQSGFEVLRAVSANRLNSHYADLVEYVTITNGQLLKELNFEGEPGIPLIVPFSGGVEREGIWASPDKIDAYLNDSTEFPAYSITPHNEADSSGRMSPVSCRFSIVSGRIKFTGYSCRLPLCIVTATKADTKVPLSLGPTVVKLSIPKLVKPGDALYSIAGAYGVLGQKDLAEIRGGKSQVNPVPSPQEVAALV